MSRAARDAGQAILGQIRKAAEKPWLAVGVVSNATLPITVTVAGQDITGVRRIASYAAPVVGDVILLALVRGTSSVQYVALGKIV